MLENIKISFKGIISHKMRSFLTMLGIIIGIASIITIVSIIQGSTNQLKENLIGSANNNVSVELYADNTPYEPQYSQISLPIGAAELTDELYNKLVAEDSIKNASAVYKRQWFDNIYCGNISLSGGSIYGVDKNFIATTEKVVVAGRGFTQADFENANCSLLLDASTADSLFEGENPLGKVVEINSIPFTVVGVVDQKNKFTPTINSIDDYYMYNSNTENSGVYIPSVCWPMAFAYDEPQSVIIDAVDKDSMSRAGKQAEEILNAELLNYTSSSGVQVEYKAIDATEIAENIQSLQNTMSMLLIFIAGISLLVGGIGVMNIMLVSVTERTREIGLKKALGAKKSVIRSQFLTEAVVLTGIGGILGVLVGIGAAYAISAFLMLPVGINPISIVVSVAFSMIIGVVFGLLPSVKASNLNPIDALRYE